MNSQTVSFCCPICHNQLKLTEKSYRCENGHCYDLAKSGYVNLLLSNKMNSKTPGDNKLMVDTRNHFLNKGYYQPLLDALCNQITTLAKNRNQKKIVLADAGCGEGYYTTGMYKALTNEGYFATILGVDISKRALELASKRAKLEQLTNLNYAVGSVFDLPIATKSCDVLTELFAPYSGEEYRRVLKKDGIMVLVIPAENHLYELKQAVYEQSYKNEVKPYELEGFTLLEKRRVTERITLEDNQDIQNLFMMTPYYYKTSKTDTDKLFALNTLTTTIDFEILCYQVASES